MMEDDVCQTRILIIDDDAAIRDLLREFLSDGHTCTEAGSAEEALELLRTEKSDLVLSDIQMGGMTGLEMVPRLLESAPDTVVIMISGISTIESAIEALRVGAFDYITKPFNFKQVGAAIRRALEHQALSRAKRLTDERYRQIVEHATDIIYRADDAGRFTFVNPIAVRLMNRPAEELRGLHYLELVRPDHRAQVEKFYGLQFVRKIPNTYFEFPAITDNETEVWLGQNVQLLTEGDRIVGFQAVARDITRQRHYDAQTDLPNRTLFEGRLTHLLIGAGRDGRGLAVLLLAPDRFKRFVDTLGHATGERLLRGVAERLTRCAGEGDLLARFGDDEFSLLLTGVSRAEEVISVTRRVYEALERPFHLGDHELYVTASIGIALHPDDGADAQALLKNGGAALFRAKKQGGNNYQFYTADINAKAYRRLLLESNLRRALEKEEFTVYYQPQLDLGTGRVTGAEALVRWQHPERGLVSPAEFIPLAEDTCLIVPVGEWVLRTACARNKAWQEMGLSPLRVAVNISPRQFQQPDLVEMVARTLEETRLDPRHLELELTESSVMQNPEEAVQKLRALKSLGIHLSVDDFGTGYSSLSYLRRLPVDILKIDQSFVREATTDADDAAIVMAVITLARSLRLKVIAEGVETQEQLEFLRLMRCDQAQGYLFSRPLPAADFERFLLAEGARAT